MFKIGDKVRRKPENCCGTPFDETSVLTVESITEDGKLLKIKDFGKELFWDSNKFDLFRDETKKESEVERLVRIANEGSDALETLAAHHVGYFLEHWEKLPMPTRGGTYSKMTLSVIKKPSFETFTVGQYGTLNSWDISLQEGVLKIGCQEFDAILFKNALASAREGNKIDLRGKSLIPGRVLTWDSYRISWQDADKIWEALEKAGV